MRKQLIFVCAIIVSIVIAGIVYLYAGGHAAEFSHTSVSPLASMSNDAGTAESAAPLEKEYKNNTFRFSVSMPEDFNVQELPPDLPAQAGEKGAHTIVLQNAKGDGIQILVTPYSDDTKVLTAADVRASIPDMKVTDEQVVEIGSDYQGVAFKSDNDAFGGASREVWFYFRGNLYQISTYERLDPLLKQMFATWKFY